ncbi:hypothetical protein CBL_02351 [Carabus blaptoides fortunei]
MAKLISYILLVVVFVTMFAAVPVRVYKAVCFKHFYSCSTITKHQDGEIFLYNSVCHFHFINDISNYIGNAVSYVLQPNTEHYNGEIIFNYTCHFHCINDIDSCICITHESTLVPRPNTVHATL